MPQKSRARRSLNNRLRRQLQARVSARRKLLMIDRRYQRQQKVLKTSNRRRRPRLRR